MYYYIVYYYYIASHNWRDKRNEWWIYMLHIKVAFCILLKQRERKITVSTRWKFLHEKFPNALRALLGTFRAMFSKAFPMYSQTMQMLYQHAGARCTRFTNTSSRLFPRRIPAPVKAKAAKCAFQFWFDDSKETTVVDEFPRDSFRECAWKRIHKKSIEIHQPYAGSASCFTVCIPSFSLFYGQFIGREIEGLLVAIYARVFSWPFCMPGSFIARIDRDIITSSLSLAQNKIQPMSFTAKSRLTLALRFSTLSRRVKKSHLSVSQHA